MLKINHVQAVMFTKMILENEVTGSIMKFATNGKSFACNMNGKPGCLECSDNKVTADFLRSVADALETRDD